MDRSFRPWSRDARSSRRRRASQRSRARGWAATGSRSAPTLPSLLLPLGSRTLYSVETDELVDRSFAAEMTANVVEEGDKGGAGDGTESDAAGNLYATNYDNAVLRRRPDTEWRRSPTIRACCGRPRCRSHGRLPVCPANQLHRQARYHEGEISVGRSTRSSASGSARSSSCCVTAARPRSSQVELGSRLAVRRR